MDTIDIQVKRTIPNHPDYCSSCQHLSNYLGTLSCEVFASVEISSYDGNADKCDQCKEAWKKAKEQKEIVRGFQDNLIKNQVDIPSEIARLTHENEKDLF